MARADFYQGHRAEALLGGEQQVLGSGALMDLKGPVQLPLGTFYKLSPAAELFLLSCPLGSH